MSNQLNTNFVDNVSTYASKDTPIIVMCRIGSVRLPLHKAQSKLVIPMLQIRQKAMRDALMRMVTASSKDGVPEGCLASILSIKSLFLLEL